MKQTSEHPEVLCEKIAILITHTPTTRLPEEPHQEYLKRRVLDIKRLLIDELVIPVMFNDVEEYANRNIPSGSAA